MAKSYTAMPYSDDYTVQRGHVSPVSSRMYHEYYNMPTDEYMRLQLELEREQKRRLQAEKVARDLTRKLRRLEDKDYADRQNADKSKQKIRELQMLSRDLIARNKEKDEYNKRLLFENEAIKRSLLEAASGIPQNLEQEFMQLRTENKKLQQRNRNLMVHFEEERYHRDHEIEELLGQLIISDRKQQILLAELDWSQRQLQEMADWMQSMREEVHVMKRAQEEEIRSGLLSPAVSITSIPNFVQKLEQSNPFQKAQELLDMMKSHNPVDLGDGASDIHSFSTEEVAPTETWSFADPSEQGSENGEVAWPTFEDSKNDHSSYVQVSRNIEDRLAAVDHLLANDEDLAEKEAQEGFLDFRLLRLHDDHMLVDAVRKNLAQIRQRKQIKTPDHRVRKSIVDFTSKGYYQRFGAKEVETLAFFDFLNDYDTDSLSDDSDEASGAILPSSPAPLLNQSMCSDDDESPADVLRSSNSRSTDTASIPTGQSTLLHRKALTPDFSLWKKLDLSGDKKAYHNGDISVYATPGLRKKRILVKAASSLAEDTKVKKTDKKVSSRRPKSMILMNEIVSLAKTEIGMKVASDLCQDGKFGNMHLSSTPSSPTQPEQREDNQPVDHKNISDSSPSKKYVVNLTTRKKGHSQSPSRRIHLQPSHSEVSKFLPQTGTSTEL